MAVSPVSKILLTVNKKPVLTASVFVKNSWWLQFHLISIHEIDDKNYLVTNLYQTHSTNLLKLTKHVLSQHLQP